MPPLTDEQSSLTAEEQSYFDTAKRATAGEAGKQSPKTAAKVRNTQPAQQRAAPAAPPVGSTEQVSGTEGEDEIVDDGTVVDDGTAQQPDPNSAAGKVVKLEALHAERNLRKDLEARYKTLEGRTNQVMELLARQQQAPQQTQQPTALKEEPMPDYNTDPAAFLAETMKRTGKGLAEVQAELAAGRENQRQAQVVQQVISQAANLERTFAAQTPDYNDASTFLIQSRQQELQALGVDAQTINNTISQERILIADMALRQGNNPAAIVYNLAKLRGYAKKELSQANGGNGQQQGNGIVQPDPAAQLAALAAGQQAGQSLSQARGQAPRPLTAQRLLELSDADFDRMMQTPEGLGLMG